MIRIHWWMFIGVCVCGGLQGGVLMCLSLCLPMIVCVSVCESCQSASVFQRKIPSDNYLGTTRVTTLDTEQT